MMEERLELYMRVPPTGRSILLVLDPFPFEDSIIDYKDVDGEVYQIYLNRYGSPSGMKAEDPWDWLRKATR